MIAICRRNTVSLPSWSALSLSLCLWLSTALPWGRVHEFCSMSKINCQSHVLSRGRIRVQRCNRFQRPTNRLYMSTTDDQQETQDQRETHSVEHQLRSRYEAAMQRRKERLAQTDISSLENNPQNDILHTSNLDEETSNSYVESEVKEESRDNIHLRQDEKLTSNVAHKDGATQGRYRRHVRKSSLQADERKINEAQTVNSYYSDDKYTEDQDYWKNPRDGYDEEALYDDYDQGHRSRSAPTCEWETYKSTSILFPPPLTQRNNGASTARPNAIIHFVGGTFFGSYPRKFYGSLLEDIACQCNSVVVATPIPLVLPGKGLVNQLEKWMFDEGGVDEDWNREQRRSRSNTETTNPLDHLSLAETIQKRFNNAYRDVILDEYCAEFVDEADVEDFMKSVPVVGIGHSLGARIQAISCSHPRVSKRCLSMGKGNRLIRSGREAMIYLGFANWGASSSIPGVSTLDRTVKRRNQGLRDQGRRDDQRRDVDKRSYRRKRRYDRYDRYQAEDLDLSDVFSDVVSGVAQGAKQIGEALSPEPEDLEFSPTPNELWDYLSSSNSWYSQSCQNNLIVQFDQDPIDQGSRLARTLLAAYAGSLNSSNTEPSDDESVVPVHDVKFARLMGGHLTPVTLQKGFAKLLPRGAVSLFSSSYDFILRQLDSERAGKSGHKQRREAKDVADTIASYILTLDG
ncbi:hypothetical protein ACHAWF_005725 [Thalassiosira exigua]